MERVLLEVGSSTALFSKNHERVMAYTEVPTDEVKADRPIATPTGGQAREDIIHCVVTDSGTHRLALRNCGFRGPRAPNPGLDLGVGVSHGSKRVS